MGGTGAGEGNRTLVVSLEGFCSTIELHPLKQKAFEPNAFVGNLMVEGDGFEPSYSNENNVQVL